LPGAALLGHWFLVELPVRAEAPVHCGGVAEPGDCTEQGVVHCGWEVVRESAGEVFLLGPGMRTGTWSGSPQGAVPLCQPTVRS
jgi:hypothetical protein